MIFFMGASQMFANILRILGGIIIVKLLMPEQLGMFNGFALILGYLPILQVGVANGLNRELPYYLGKGNKEVAHNFASVAQYWEILLAIISCSILFILGVFYFFRQDYISGISCFAYTFAVGHLFYGTYYLQILYRTNQDFNKLSLITLIVSVVSFLSILFVWLWGYYGLCARLTILSSVEFFLLWKWKPIQVKANFNKKIFVDIIKIGIPIYVVGIIFSLWATFQNTLVLKIGGVEQYGFFALAIMVQSSLEVLTSAVSQVLYPKMAYEYGKGKRLSEILVAARKPIIVILCFLLPSLVLVWFILPYIVNFLMPQYNPGIKAAQWTLPLVLLSVLSIYNLIFNIVKRQQDYLWTLISGIGSFVIVLFICYWSKGYSLLIFPFAMICGKAVQLIHAFFYIRSYQHKY